MPPAFFTKLIRGKIMDENKLLEATRRLLDLKTEKKNYNKEINDQIKDTESEIKKLAAETGK
jgi:hypothetical protein